MKKILLITLLCTIFSCSHQNQKVTLDIQLKPEKSEIGKGSFVRVFIFDKRADRKLLGTKTFGDQKVKISIDQRLNQLLREKITENLTLKGFKRGRLVSLKLYIKNLDFTAKRGFPVGTSKATSSIKVVVQNSITEKTLTKNFNLNFNSYHFIASKTTTDAKTINSILQEIIQNILDDKSVLEALIEKKQIN